MGPGAHENPWSWHLATSPSAGSLWEETDISDKHLTLWGSQNHQVLNCQKQALFSLSSLYYGYSELHAEVQGRSTQVHPLGVSLWLLGTKGEPSGPSWKHRFWVLAATTSILKTIIGNRLHISFIFPSPHSGVCKSLCSHSPWAKSRMTRVLSSHEVIRYT